MNINCDSYYQEILEDLATYKDLDTSLNASMMERLLVRQVPTDQLHANPDDEFSMEDIGPNEELVSLYRDQMVQNMKTLGRLNIKPLMVEKMLFGGYKILDGHHRWLAARMLHVKKLPVRIVNHINKNEILSALEQSDHKICVAFDLDDVLLRDKEDALAARIYFGLMTTFYPKAVRKNAAALIDKLQEMSFDVWVYTGGYYSGKYIQSLLKCYGIKNCQVLNGMRKQKFRKSVRQYFHENYRIMMHVDNESVLWIDTRTKEYDWIDVPRGKDWAVNVYKVIKDFLVKRQRES